MYAYVSLRGEHDGCSPRAKRVPACIAPDSNALYLRTLASGLDRSLPPDSLE
jgi:hypothetical protein